MSRFEDVTEDVIDLVEYVRKEWFPELGSAKIKIMFDLKKRLSVGKVVLARIQKSNEIMRYLTTEEADSEEGFDYFLYIDKMCWNNCEDGDKIRLLRHEFSHSWCDINTSNNPWKLQGHEISDFHAEIERNQDDPRWAERCAELTLSLYEGQE